ncbi:hypothetical protein [Thermoplasma volcanium GSS1]|uniref:Uncharacterized protein n=1 Tax=Thermoplasma volcanium (strain ATCC 51530 / DSM 4299 / JCM 9571 / NBRC 15438 / GSS1) TaxID=273116 RepID=Q97C66_THEVO|nr:helix-turn-helix domain-containing protein [Thermoplasma volcanium]BAB59380.1 hypothetical protein [Thermoplasma volcanium GSS1]
MDEIEMDLENDLPFCKLSKDFPQVSFYRWCNSAIDYLEFYGNKEDLDSLEKYVPEIEKSLNTNSLYRSRSGGRLSVILSCRCNVSNSTIRKAEHHNLMWKAPVFYNGGHEKLSVISPRSEDFLGLFKDLEDVGKVRITKKIEVDPDLVRDIYSISLSDLFSDLTEKQLRYLVSAYHNGYFDVPKRTNIVELAKQFNISYSTLQEHLEKAVNKIMKGIEPYLTIALQMMGGKE